jgi:hypothetical protein
MMMEFMSLQLKCFRPFSKVNLGFIAMACHPSAIGGYVHSCFVKEKIIRYVIYSVFSAVYKKYGSLYFRKLIPPHRNFRYSLPHNLLKDKSQTVLHFAVS